MGSMMTYCHLHGKDIAQAYCPYNYRKMLLQWQGNQGKGDTARAKWSQGAGPPWSGGRDLSQLTLSFSFIFWPLGNRK